VSLTTEILLLVIAILVVAVIGFELAYVLTRLYVRNAATLAAAPLAQRRLRRVTWYAAVFLSAASIVALLIGCVGLFRVQRARDAASLTYSHAELKEQYSSIKVEPGLSLSATDQRTVSGQNPLPDEVFLIDATLKDYRLKSKGCTPKNLDKLIAASDVRLNGIMLSISNPAVSGAWFPAKQGSGGVCAAKWEWVARATAHGRLAAVVALKYRKDRQTTIYRTKVLPFAMAAITDTEQITRTVTSIVVALISLAGVLFGAWWRGR